MTAATRKQREFYPGTRVPITGVYRAVHTAHERSHEVTAIRGEMFPPCRTCGEHVAFTLMRQASHVTHDMDFAGPDYSLA